MHAFFYREKKKNATRRVTEPVDCMEGSPWPAGRVSSIGSRKRLVQYSLSSCDCTYKLARPKQHSQHCDFFDLPVTTNQHLGTVSRCHGMVIVVEAQGVGRPLLAEFNGPYPWRGGRVAGTGRWLLLSAFWAEEPRGKSNPIY